MLLFGILVANYKTEEICLIAFCWQENGASMQIYSDDLESFNALYQEHSAKVYFNILRMVKDPEAAQEILQDIFVKVWEKRGLIQPGKPWAPYLYQVAKHAVYDYFRRAVVVRKAEAHLKAEDDESYSHIEEDIYFKESHKLLWKAIGKLSPQRKQVYTLCKIEGKSYCETSRILGISVSTVSDHMLKANRFIRSELVASEVFTTLLIILSINQ